MKIWLDDIRCAPEGFVHCRSVNEAIAAINEAERRGEKIELVDCDHDLGDYAFDGGDGIRLIDHLAEHEKYYPIRLHTMNPVGRDNMRRTVERYWPGGRCV